MNIATYFDTLMTALATISPEQVDCAAAILDDAYRHDCTIYVIGNGQSAASASAFALDFTKQTASSLLERRFRVISLTDNLSALTAWANDVGYDAIFTEQLKSLFRAGDVLVAISVSGTSPNVVNACEWVRQRDGQIIALTGFEGGSLHALAHASIVVNSRDFGHVETAHIAVMHFLVDLFRERLAK